MSPRPSWPQWPISLPFLVAATYLACGDEPTGSPVAAGPFFPPDFLAGYIQVRDCRLSIAHDSHNVRVFASPGQADAYVDGVHPLASGAVFVKILYRDPDCADLAAYLAMRKGAPDTAPEAGDWEWQEVDAAGKVLQPGPLPACISCHKSCAEGRDFTCADP